MGFLDTLRGISRAGSVRASIPSPDKPRPSRSGGIGTRISGGALESLDPNREVRSDLWLGAPGRLGVARKMLRDPHVRQSIAYHTGPICGADWRLRPASSSALDLEVAAFVEWCLLERLPWVQVSERIIRDYMADGVSLSELTDDYAPIPPSRFPLHPGGGVGVVVTGIHEIPCWTVARWHQSQSNAAQLASVEQYLPGSDAEQAGQRSISADRILRLTYGQDGANFSGLAMLRSAYGAWKLKLAFQAIAAIKHERLGVGIPVLTLPEEIEDEDIDAAEQVLSEMRTNARGYAVFKNGSSFKWEGATQSDGTNIEAAIEQCNKDIAINAGAGFMMLGLTGKSGSYALGSTQQGQHHLFVSYHARVYADAWNIGYDGWSPIERLVRLNYGPDAGLPWLEARNLPTSDWATRVPQLINAVNAGIITPDDHLENVLREILEVDPLDRATARPRFAPVSQTTAPVEPVPEDDTKPTQDDEQTENKAVTERDEEPTE